jgi:hypothetical protein
VAAEVAAAVAAELVLEAKEAWENMAVFVERQPRPPQIVWLFQP